MNLNFKRNNLLFTRTSLVFIIFFSFLHAKELQTNNIDTNLIMIKIATLNSKINSEKTIKKLNLLGFDTLTLQHKFYELYVANVKDENYNNAMQTVHQYFPSAYKSKKNKFTTEGIYLLTNSGSNKFEDLNVTSFDTNTSKNTNLGMDSNDTNLSSNLIQLDDNLNLNNPTKKETKTGTDNLSTFFKTDTKPVKIIQEVPYLSDTNIQKENSVDPSSVKIELIDAVLQTLSISYKIKASKEKMIQAKHNIDIAYGDYMPSIDVAYTLAKTDSRPGDYTPEQVYDEAKYYTDESYSISLNQNIYAGGATKNEIERLKAQYLVAKTDFKRLLEDEILKAITSYIDVVFTRESKEVNKKNMDVLTTIFEIVKAKYDAGALSIGELSNIEASVSNAKSLLSKTNSSYNNALEYFKYITGELFQQTYPYEKIVHVSIDPLEEILENISKKNTSMLSYKYTIESKKASLLKLKSSFRPKVDLTISAERVTDEENYEFDEKTFTAQLQVSYNLFNGNKDKNQYLKAFSAIQEVVYERESEKRKIKWELEKLHTSLTSLQDNLSNVEDEVTSSTNMVSSYWESFRNGEQDLPVLLQGQRQLNTAELSYIKSQQDSMKDYFEILQLAGDLLSYFEIDITKENYLDMAKAKFRLNHLPQVQEVSSVISTTSPIQKDDLNTTQSSLEQEDNQTAITELLSFNEKFLIEDQNKFTIALDNLGTPIDALRFISDFKIINKSFLYQYFDKQKIKTKIAYGIFDSKEDAQVALNDIFQNQDQKSLKIISIGKVQDEFTEFSTISFVNANDVPKVKPKPIIAKKVEKPFQTDIAFKEKFLTAPKDYFTINITTLSSMKSAGKVVKDEKIELNSFVFKFGYKKDWYKLMYGVYPTYEEAKIAIESLKTLSTIYLPIIEKVDLKQKLYKKFNKQ